MHGFETMNRKIRKAQWKWAPLMQHFGGYVDQLYRYGVPISYAQENRHEFVGDVLISYFSGLSPRQVHEEMVGPLAVDYWDEGGFIEFLGATGQSVVFQISIEDENIEFPIHKAGRSLQQEMGIWERLKGNPQFLQPNLMHGDYLDAIIFNGDKQPSVRSRINALRLGKMMSPFDLGLCVFSQLDELRTLGVCHRDIRPENIILYGTWAAIIDFGIADDSPDAVPMHNRRYGGTDLMSLGQLMYKCSTGKNLFNAFNMPSLEAAGRISSLRKKFCDDADFRSKYLDMVLDRVSDPVIAKGIETCLMAGLRLGDKPLSCPKEVRDAAYLEVKEFFIDHDPLM